MKFINKTLLVLLSVYSVPSFAADKYEFDKSHTRILFYINHLGFSDMVGEFTDYDGHFTFDPQNPEDSSVEVTLKPSGIRTSSKALDDKLQGDSFFKTDKFPTIKFTSKKIKILGEKTGEVEGIATMLGVSKPTTMTVHFNKADYHPFTQNFMAGFSASATLKRSEFGMDSYLPDIGDEVRIEVQTEGINMDRKKKESLNHR
jgi:polyisoprenoid-binding protein YceI